MAVKTLKTFHSIRALPKEFNKRISNEKITNYPSYAKWIYKKLLVSGTTRTVFSDYDSFAGDIFEEALAPAAEVYDHLDASADFLLYFYIRNTGFSSTLEVNKVAHPIMLGIGDAITLAFNGTGVNRPLAVFPGESTSLRFSGNADMKAQDIDIRTGISNDGIALNTNGAETDRVLVEIVALVKDVA